jgi:hypothetical protein
MNRRERRKQQIARQAVARTTPAQNPEHTVEAAPELVMHPGAATGPRTEQGKAISSRNAVRHGLCSKRLTGADLEAFNTIRAKLDYEWGPQTETESMLLAQMALSQWRLDRALELELAAFDEGEIDPATLTLALRYRSSAERTFFKSLAELQRLRAAIRMGAEHNEAEERTAASQTQAQHPVRFADQNREPDKSASLSQTQQRPSGFVSQNDRAARLASHFVSQNASTGPDLEAA